MSDQAVPKVDYTNVIDSARVWAKHLARTRFTDLPPKVVIAAKAQILDGLACAIAGTAGPEIGTLVNMVEHDGGREEASIIGGKGLKVPAAAAVFVNAALIHQDDFDDCSENGPSHPTSASLPTALAMAEVLGGKSGKDLILAVALSNDLTCRLSRAIRSHFFDYPWFRPIVVGLFGATAAAAVIAGLDEDKHYQALGLTLPMVSVTWASMNELGSSVRSIRDGLSYRNAILATRLAIGGLRGDAKAFDGRYGFFQAYFNGNYDPEHFIADLGTFYETEHVFLKAWPSIKLIHNQITAALKIMDEQKLEFDDIVNVEFEVGRINAWRCYPVEKGLVPERRIDLLKNLPFALAAAIRHRGIPLAVYRDRATADDVVETAFPKISWRETERQSSARFWEVARVKVTTTSGNVFEGECDAALGHADNPMSDEQRHAKFRDCLAHAASRHMNANADAIIDVVDNLENIDDIETLVALIR